MPGKSLKLKSDIYTFLKIKESVIIPNTPHKSDHTHHGGMIDGTIISKIHL